MLSINSTLIYTKTKYHKDSNHTNKQIQEAACYQRLGQWYDSPHGFHEAEGSIFDGSKENVCVGCVLTNSQKKKKKKRGCLFLSLLAGEKSRETFFLYFFLIVDNVKVIFILLK